MDNSTKLYFIEEHSGEPFHHGGVGNTDIETIFLRQKFKPIVFPYQDNFSFKAKLSRFWHCIKLFFFMPGGSVVIFQYPLYARIHKLLLKFLHYRKSIEKICFILDINGLKNGDAKVLQNDQLFFKQNKSFVLHNASMKNWLDGIIPRYAYSMVCFFDFLAQPYSGNRNKSNQLVFAGNLYKSLFLEKWDQVLPLDHGLTINLYGPAITESIKGQKGISYKGVFNPYELPQIVEGSFGLVWDGDGSFNNNDSVAHYMQYISHHKLSLYILSGLPIIIYSKAGSSYLVEEYNIGFTINSLNEIEEKIRTLSDQEYQQMRENMKALAAKISTGGCLSSALEKILAQIKESRLEKAN